MLFPVAATPCRPIVAHGSIPICQRPRFCRTLLEETRGEILGMDADKATVLADEPRRCRPRARAAGKPAG